MRKTRHALNAQVKIEQEVTRILRENSEYYQLWFEAWLASQTPESLPTRLMDAPTIRQEHEDHSTATKMA